MNKIRKDDNVIILTGKDRGKTGKVLRLVTKKESVLVEGINISKRHVKSQGQVEGGIIDLIKPVHISNVALVDPKTKKAARVGFKMKDGKKIRVFAKSGEEIK
jgi:large subunit ribosomal protein L24